MEEEERSKSNNKIRAVAAQWQGREKNNEQRVREEKNR